MSGAFEDRKREGFETFRPSEPETARYNDLKRPEVLTLEAIERDPWNAVALEVPADADRKLLARTAKAAQNEMVNAEGYLAVAASGEEEAYWGERIEKAARRIGDVQVRLGATETLDQVQDRHRDEYEHVHGAFGVEELPSQLAARHDRESAAWPGKPAPEIEPDYAAHMEGPRDTNFLSPGFILRGLTEHLARFVDLVLDVLRDLTEHLARFVDLVLGVVIGFFVDEPKLTAAQVHDTLQARGNVETIHANEVAVAARENLAAHDWQSSMTISGQQEHDLMAAMTLGGNATAEAQLSEGHEPVRERRRSRHL